MIKIRGATLHNKQKEIFNKILKSQAKYFIINASRQSGKSFLLRELLRYYALTYSSYSILYVTPTYDLGSIFFKSIKTSLENIPIIKHINNSELSIEFINGTTIKFKSAERYDNIRGGSYDVMMLDEFSFFKLGAWDVIRPLTAAKKHSKVIIASTPKGKNLFYDLSMLGQSLDNDRYEYYYMHYTDNPLYDLIEVTDAKKTLPEDIYRTEYEAEFIDDGGTVFKNINKCQLITQWSNPQPNIKYVAGLDIGKKDSTVLTILNNSREIVYIHIVKNKPYPEIINEISHILNLYNPITYVETNGVGDVFYDMLIKSYSNLVAWNNNNTSKTNIIELLINSIASDEIKLPTKELCPELDFELKVFTYTYNPKTRHIHYAATPPHHDDTVLSLAIANYASSQNPSNIQYFKYKNTNPHKY